MNRSVLVMTLFLLVATTRADERPNMVFFTRHAKYVTFQLAEVAVPRQLFAAILD